MQVETLKEALESLLEQIDALRDLVVQKRERLARATAAEQDAMAKEVERLVAFKHVLKARVAEIVAAMSASADTPPKDL
jgi:CHASE3 domain sensor protein